MEPKKILIGGEWRETSSVMDVLFPYDQHVVAQVYQASDEDIEDALAAAVRGFEITRRLPAHERSRILCRLLEQMQARQDELIEALVLEGGKTQNVASGEAARACETVRVAAEEAKRLEGELVPMDWTVAGEGRMALVRRFPIGPVVGIAPFNYPLNLAAHKLAPAVAAGNSFLLKPASATPLSALLLGEMLLEAGFPPEAISVIVCPGSRAEKLVTDPRPAYVTFTGSSEVGWGLKSKAGRKRVGLELGGNAAVVVHDDANLDYAASRIAMGGFANAGQNCISVQRVLLQRSIYDEVLALILEKTGHLKTGDPRDMEVTVGPMIDQRSAKEAFDKVQEAVQQGAQVLVGGQLTDTLMQPTILANTMPDMQVNATEIFAPVISVIPYDTFEEALQMANETDYGLQAGVFTQNMNRILMAYETLEVGGVEINDVSTFQVDQMTSGGVKDSGVGREGPRYAIEEMTEPKLMVINQNGGLE